MNEKQSQKTSRLRYFLLGGTLAAAISVAALQLQADNESRGRATDIRVHVDTSPLNRASGPAVTSFAPVVKQVAPSVVTLTVTQKGQRVQMRGNPFMEDPFWSPFFGGPQGGGPREYRTPDRQGVGSGVIVSKDGYILTNNHVVDGADEVEVQLSNGETKEYTAKVVGRDPKSDLAVLKIEAKDLPAITFGDSDQTEVGDLVLAIGNPFGVGQTVTMGMVSGTGRANLGLDYEDFIQTDAAINPGNSGGALIDAQGRLIGVNTAILSRSGGNQGIGFAVPVNLARSVMESLVEHGRVIRGFLGVNIQPVSGDLATAFKLPAARGALVAQVTPDSPAEAAGIKDGDVIVKFDGRPVRDDRHLKLLVGQTLPDTKVQVEIVRDGDPEKLTATVKELPGDPQLARGERAPGRSDERLAGVIVSDIDAGSRRQMALPRNVQGALVTQVEEDSAAYKGGLRPGDVILEIGREKVGNAADAVQLADRVEGDQVLLRVWRDGATRYLVVNEPLKK